MDRPNLFIVDRDPHICRLVGQFLGDDYALEIFSSGYAALDRARLVPPAALITEMLIAELDGLALCRLLKGDPVTRHVPILVLSMLASSERAKQSGADAFLQKPIQRNRLITAMRNIAPSTTKTRASASSPPEQHP